MTQPPLSPPRRSPPRRSAPQHLWRAAAGLALVVLALTPAATPVRAEAPAAASPAPATAGMVPELCPVPPSLPDLEPVTTHALALHGEPKYPPDFQHLDYVNPDAPKGGTLTLWDQDFDSLNPFIAQGNPLAGAALIYDTLLYNSSDEAFSEYGLLAESITVPPDRSWVEFTLRPQARWHDGQPVTVDDVIFTLDLLRTQGVPFYRSYFGNVAKAEAAGEHTVRFTFDVAGNAELPLILGQMPILPKHYWQDREFTRVTLDPPLGSGPYRIGQIIPNQSGTLERVPDYWGADLPVNRGRHNFDRYRYVVLRDSEIARQALFAGDLDFWQEFTASAWATGYDRIPAVRQGRIVKETIPHSIPQGMQSFVFNLRRPQFQDVRVREAINLLFDWATLNDQLAYGAYTRSRSYFSNSELASSGLPEGAELAYLEPLRGLVPDSVFDQVYVPPNERDGMGDERARLRAAHALLQAAGYDVVAGRRIHRQTGQPLALEFLYWQDGMERWIQPFLQALQRVGIATSLRQMEQSRYIGRLREFDYDMIVGSWGQSLSPGNEQREFWGSAAADQQGSRNYMGLKDPVIDAMIECLIVSPDRETLVTRTRALDRVLLAGHYMVPMHHISAYRLAYWDVYDHMPLPAYDLALDAWWEVPGRRAEVMGTR